MLNYIMTKYNLIVSHVIARGLLYASSMRTTLVGRTLRMRPAVTSQTLIWKMSKIDIFYLKYWTYGTTLTLKTGQLHN
jgi:hypothetical protein